MEAEVELTLHNIQTHTNTKQTHTYTEKTKLRPRYPPPPIPNLSPFNNLRHTHAYIPNKQRHARMKAATH